MKRARFAAAFETGRRVGGGLVSGRAIVGEGALGVAVTKKARTKPRRNRIKRRILAAYRASGETHAGLDVVLIASLPCLQEPFAELTGAVAHRLRELRAASGAEAHECGSEPR